MGYPSVFNADMVIQEQMRVGKSLEDAREGGTSGCIETGCSGKEAYLLHGYLNVPKLLEYVLSNGVDLLTGKQVSIKTGELSDFKTFDDLYAAFEKQMAYVVDTKIGVDNYLRYQYATNMAATYLSCVINDCIKNGKDYYNGGPRYNSDYIQCCGIGTITDSLSAIKKHVYDEGTYTLQELVDAMKANWEGHEAMRLTLWNKTPFFGNDDDYADDIMRRVYDSLFRNIDGKHSILGPTYHLNMLSTTCHNYFGQKLAATPNGRFSGMPESDGTSPSHGADRHGPTAVVKSLGKMDQVKSGGTLLNQRFLPVQRRRRSDAARRPGPPGQLPRPPRPRRGLQRLLRRPRQLPAGRDHSEKRTGKLLSFHAIHAKKQNRAPRRKPRGFFVHSARRLCYHYAIPKHGGG